MSPMNPRLLSPRATGFDPRSVSGLALWLDASASGSLYTTDAGPVTAVSSPAEISGCALWLDADDSSSITADGSNLVSQWSDKSGNARHATSSGSNRPTRTAAAQNGRAVMTFDGTASQMQIDSTFLVTSNATIFAVARRTSGSFGAVITSKGTADTSPALQHASGSWQINHAGNLSVIGTTSGYAVLTGAISAGATSAFSNGLLQDSDASSGSLASDATKTYIGTYRAAVANVLAGEIAEIVVYNTALSTADRARVESYLAAKWGISGVHAAATAASAPVGYWMDRSGNGRHAVQTTGANRPTVGASSAAGKAAVRNNGTGSVSLLVSAWPYVAGNTQIVVFNASNYNQGICQRGSLNDEPRLAIQTAAVGNALFATRGGSVQTATSSTIGYTVSQWSIGAGLFNTSLGRAYRDGVYGEDVTDSQSFSGDQELRLLSLPSNIYGLNGGIAEFLHYDRQLTALEVSRISAYLSRKWGITLAPTVSNADAQDWINRVYTNGGSVSVSTANAVNTFCNAIDSAGIRSKFLRLNLFAGNDLTSALVPLYRSSAYGGAVVGNAIDTNNNFVSGDYVETGASGGLASSTATKYLNTGVQPFASGSAIASEGHLSFWAMTQPPSRQSIIGARKDSATTAFGSAQLDNTGKGWFGWDASTSLSGVTVGSAPLFGVVTRRSDGKTYMEGNGVAVANATSTAAGTTTASFGVFGHILDTGGVGLAALRMAGYSVGSALSASEGASLYSAWRTLQQSLGRL